MSTGTTRTDSAPVHMRVPFAASSVSIARLKLKQWMSDNGTSCEHIDDARVIVSELVANAVRHARPLPDGNLLIAWRVEDLELEVAVTDGGGPTRPRSVNAPASALAGRGMAIIEALSLSWKAERTRSGSTVRARLSIA